MQPNEVNAYRLNDRYQIVIVSTDQCVGVEHNQTEAEAIAKWLTHTKGQRHAVVRNGLDTVRAACLIRPHPIRVACRDEILQEMGLA